MKHVIVGTAGHVDHGKTTLIRALTGIETDRLREEQQRGISIEIGFAYFDLPSGRRAGIIDVPGHERFIKNMLAGIAGVDLALLVVAADEGVMPQTVEHLNILSLLQIQQGLVVITKRDLVEADWLELVEEEVRERLQGSFLENAEILAVSATTGEGLPALVAAIDRLTSSAQERDSKGVARLPVDRVFSVSGFGTVITGTLLSGSIALGDRLDLLPRGMTLRVRSLQVHGERVEEVLAGQRAAVNLAGIDQDQLQRGDVLASLGTLKSTMMLDARLHHLSSSPRALQQRTRVRVYSGAAEVMARLTPLEEEIIEPGQSSLVQLRLEEPLAVDAGGIFILRSYSPMTTIAGGTIIDPHPHKKTRFREAQVAALRIREQGDPLQQAMQQLYTLSPTLPDREAFLHSIPNLPEATDLLEELIA
ncbi:MAG: selenocysteine-specific translation elongation factor, partial [Symbiobacteriaceae bacterium]|nr:selenocysteine-specific translation elongation factor [Symbiobacteriaceae bacterium]